MVSVLRSALCGASGSDEQDSVILDGEVVEVARTHRQYLDGTGYPCGIGGRESPNIARIVSIRDLFAALIERRRCKAPTTARGSCPPSDDERKAGRDDPKDFLEYRRQLST